MQQKNRRRVALATATAASLAGVVVTAETSMAAHPEQAKNVIYLVGDGMGLTHINAARLRYEGAAGRLDMETLPVTGDVSTYAVEQDSDQPNYVTDSASSATAWSSGVKTYNAAIGKDAYGKTVSTIMEQAKKAGLRTGNVSTAEITDATPAAPMAHVSQRACQGPSTQKADPETCAGETPIAQQVARNGIADVILGGGLQRFEPADQRAMERNGYDVLGSFGKRALPAGGQTAASQTVATLDELKDVRRGGKVIGLFNRGNLTVERNKQLRPDAPEADEPTLEELTRQALRLLTPGGKKSSGFLLQVEGALIDKRSHANDAAQTLEEIKAFDDAVGAALDFAKKDGNTLVVVTADHECAGFNIIGKGSFTNAEAATPPGNVDSGNLANTSERPRPTSQEKDAARSPGIYNAPGSTQANTFGPATFRTPDDPKGVKDGTEDASLWLSYLSGNHTGADVPVSAYGPGSKQFEDQQDNTDHYDYMRAALRLK